MLCHLKVGKVSFATTLWLSPELCHEGRVRLRPEPYCSKHKKASRISTFLGSYSVSFMGHARCIYAPTNAATQQLNSSCYSDLLIPCTLKAHSFSRIRSSTGKEQCAVICYKQIMSSSLIPYWEKLGHLRKGEQTA